MVTEFTLRFRNIVTTNIYFPNAPAGTVERTVNQVTRKMFYQVHDYFQCNPG